MPLSRRSGAVGGSSLPANSKKRRGADEMESLSSGAIERIYCTRTLSRGCTDASAPTLQVWEIEIPTSPGDLPRIILSDGVHFQRGTLAPPLRPSEIFTENCVVRLKKYRRTDDLELHIIDLDIVAPAQAERIGNPVSIETAPCGLNVQLALEIINGTLSAEGLASLIVAGAQVDAPAPAGDPSRIPLVRAVNTGSPAIVQWLIDAGASVQPLLDGRRVDVLHYTAAVGNLECLQVLLDTGKESSLHDAAELLGAVGQLVNREALMTEMLREMFERDPDFNPDEYAGDFDLDLEDMIHDKLDTKANEIHQTITDVLDQRALVQAHRRLALCAGACGSRLGVESPIGQTNADVIEYLLTEHLLIGKPRMPGAAVSGAVLRRFARH